MMHDRQCEAMLFPDNPHQLCRCDERRLRLDFDVLRDDRDALHAELGGTRAELDRVREALQPARDALAAIDSSTDEARQRTGRMAEDACFYAAQRALMALDAARASGSNDLRHVCGERGYNRMIDPACPACEQSRHNAARKETSHD